VSSTLGERVKESTLDLLFPRRCVGCGVVGWFLCPTCVGSLPRINPPVCPLCGKPQPIAEQCPGCWGRQTSLNGNRSPFRFEGTIRRAVHGLKYHNLRALSEPLAHLVAVYWSLYPLPADVLVPVPLHAARLRERGYNQSSLLAKHLSGMIGVETLESVLIRRENTPPQARTSSAEQRQLNVRGAFAVRGRGIKGKRVVVIDDVCTSGATLDACALALKRAGATSVWGLTLAKEI
jgi:ComF family protein